MKIEKIEIKGLFGKKDICWELNPQVNVLVGVNGSGKSTILSTLCCMLKNIPNSSNSMIFDTAEIYFINKEIKPIVRKNNVKHQIFDIEEVARNISEEILNGLVGIEFKAKRRNDETKLLQLKKDELSDRVRNDIREKLMKSAQDVDGNKVLVVSGTEQIVESKELFKKFNITMISTLNLSVNAIFEFKGSNAEVLNILDLEMDKVLNQFNQKSDEQIQEKLMNSLNFFLNTVNKNAEYKNHSIVYFDTDIQKELKFSDLSSGERQLVYILVQVALNATGKEKSSIILMDEPEISLHLNWQAHFIKQLTILNPDAQFIIVTHSPALIMNGWNDVYVNMEEIVQ